MSTQALYPISRLCLDISLSLTYGHMRKWLQVHLGKDLENCYSVYLLWCCRLVLSSTSRAQGHLFSEWMMHLKIDLSLIIGQKIATSYWGRSPPLPVLHFSLLVSVDVRYTLIVILYLVMSFSNNNICTCLKVNPSPHPATTLFLWVPCMEHLALHLTSLRSRLNQPHEYWPWDRLCEHISSRLPCHL